MTNADSQNRPLVLKSNVTVLVNWAKISVIVVSLLLLLFDTGSARAQNPSGGITPLQVEPDPSGLDLLGGKVQIDGPVLAIPAAPRLTFVRGSDWYLNVYGQTGPNGSFAQDSFTVNYGGMKSIAFKCDYGFCKDVLDVSFNAPSASRFNVSNFDFLAEATGETYHFTVPALDYTVQGPTAFERYIDYYASSIVYPDGETISLEYHSQVLSATSTAQRPWRITSSTGYFIELEYQSSTPNSAGWFRVATATIYKTTAPSTPLARLTYSTDSTQVSDIAGRTWVCQPDCGNEVGARPWRAVGSVRLPGTAIDQRVATSANGATTTALQVDGVNWTYSYGGYQDGPGGQPTFTSVAVNGPLEFSRTYEIAVEAEPPPPGSNESTARNAKIKGFTNSLGQRTDIQQDDKGRVMKITAPEGNGVQVVRDFMGNITEKRTFAKPGAGLADLVEVAQYDVSACNDVRCWRPTWTRDATQHQTDYTWASHGGLLTRLDPIDGNGQRRKVKITYDGIHRPTAEETCAANGAGTELTCGTSASFVKLTAYFENTRLPVSETVTDGVGTTPLTTTYTYDSAGRRLSVNPPLPGDDDATFYRYDVLGRRTWEIGPKGSNGLRLATRTTYRDADDQPSAVESGNVTSESDPNLVVFRRADTAYDLRRLPVASTIFAAGITDVMTQTSYDARNRKECVTTRMNSAVFGAAPADACTLSPTGPSGLDRITRNIYDTESRVLTVQKAAGTSIQQDYVTYTYSANGKQTSVTDANGNKAALTYDGFDRQSGWYFPDKVTIGVVSTTDYEAYGYDANGNRTSHRKRDGRVLTLQYDALNRVTAKLVPDGCAPLQAGACPPASATRDVYYGYDLRGLQLYARFDSPGGEGVTNSYDAFGRQTSTTTAMGGLSATIGHDYDANGNQLGTTYPDGQRFGFGYDGVNRQVSVADPSGTINIQAVFNDQGQLATLTRAVGASSYGYDPIGRLTLANHAFTPSSLSTSTTLGYNPASQITSQTRNNNAYAWTGAYNINRPYSVNGLNQYTSAGTASFSYDANGNLISQVTPEGTVSYGYDVENRLISSSQGVALRYDPLGRLFEVQRASELTRFVHDNDAIIAEYGAANQLLNRYVHGAGVDDPLIWYEGSTTATSVRRFLFANHQGSVIATTNPSGSGVAINAYDDYGIPDQRNTGRFQYTGQAWLNELGMYYYKARIYSPSLGRFLQTDPIGYDDQINLYAYVANDPINEVDPDGKQRKKFIEAILRGLVMLTGNKVPRLPPTPPRPPISRPAPGDQPPGPRVIPGKGAPPPPPPAAKTIPIPSSPSVGTTPTTPPTVTVDPIPSPPPIPSTPPVIVTPPPPSPPLPPPPPPIRLPPH